MIEARIASSWRIDPQMARALAEGTHGDPFSVLGPHDTPDGRIIRAFVPGARGVEVVRRADGTRIDDLKPALEGVFENIVACRESYLLRIGWPDGIQ
jgi:1,4-alpha-glucan branching enzyme